MAIVVIVAIVTIVAHPEHRLKHRSERLLPQDDVARPEVPRCDEVATSFRRKLEVDPA